MIDSHGMTFLYYVMPFVAGETLRARLERDRQLPIEEAIRTAREVADALGYAHGLGVIHRDTKPENILLQGGHALGAVTYEMLVGEAPFTGPSVQVVVHWPQLPALRRGGSEPR